MDATISRLNTLNLVMFEKSIKTMKLEELKKLKDVLDDRYYNTGEETISDDKYDIIADIFSEHSVGCKLRDTDNATKLPFHLNSMDKVKKGEVKKLEKFVERVNNNNYIVSDKLNGVSCLVCYGSDPSDIKMYTRGDGDVGADISYFKSKIDGIVSGVKNLNIRGELIITKDDFEKHYSSEYKNSLALLVSVVNAKTLKEPIKHVKFVAYEIVTEKPSKKPSENMAYLSKLGFYTVENTLLSSLDDVFLSEYLQKRYTSGLFSIDGIIVQVDTPYDRNSVSASGNPDYAIAYKIITDSCETEVEDVLWAPSRYSTLKPRVQIKPVELCGATIKYVTGSNAKFIQDNKINKGSKVLIIRAGEIIPKIERVLTMSKEAKMPCTPYKWNETGVDIVSTNDEDDNDVVVRKLAFFFSTIGVKQIAEGIIKKLVDCGYDDLYKIMEMTEHDFMKVPTFEKKMSQRLRKSLDEVSGMNIDMSVLMAASGIFGQGLGAKKLKTLTTAIPSILFKTPSKSEIEAVNGFSDKTATKILEGLDRFKEFYEKFSKYLTINEEVVDYDESVFTHEEIQKAREASGISSRLKGEVIVFTNFRDGDMEKKLVNAGAEISESVTKKTTCLVVPDGNTTTTGKVAKAKQYGVKILEKTLFAKSYGF